MSKLSVASRSSFTRFAAPVGALLLTGLLLGYAFQGGGAETLPSTHASASIPVADTFAAAPVDPVAQRLGKVAARRTGRVDSAVFSDLPSALAQMHQGLSNAPIQQAKRDRIVADLESQHEAESIDATWSATSEQSLVAASVAPVMAQAGFNPQDMTTDCRSRTCRISARFENSIDAKDWADRLLTQMGNTISQAKVAVLPQADGSFEVRVYGARKQS